jgi:release factor glutamine methyltransferase
MTDDPWTTGRLLAWTIDYFAQREIENPRLDAEILLAAARGCKRIDLYAAYGEEASEEIRTAFRELVRRRAEGTPVAYLVGHREFYSLDFEVTPDVLIPRPETEHLVVALVDYFKGRGARGEGREGEASAAPASDPRPPTSSPHIADIGTGSGVLAVCAAKYVPHAHVTAIDVSPAALAVARRNAERHGVADRIEFKEADLLAAEPAEPRFDAILSNPPYVSTAEMAELPAEVRDHEPHAALHAGQRGTEVIERLIEQASHRLQLSGLLLIEISPMIATAVEALINNQPALDLHPTHRDLAGHARVVQAART